MIPPVAKQRTRYKYTLDALVDKLREYFPAVSYDHLVVLAGRYGVRQHFWAFIDAQGYHEISRYPGEEYYYPPSIAPTLEWFQVQRFDLWASAELVKRRIDERRAA